MKANKDGKQEAPVDDGSLLVKNCNEGNMMVLSVIDGRCARFVCRGQRTSQHHIQLNTSTAYGAIQYLL